MRSEEIVTVVHREAARLLGLTTQGLSYLRDRGVLTPVAHSPIRYALTAVEALRAARAISKPKRLKPAPVQIVRKSKKTARRAA